MNLTHLFSRIPKVLDNYHLACHADYQSMVVAIADGHEPEPVQIREILLANDKSVDDLQADVKLLLERRQLRVQYDGLPQLYQQKDENEQRIAEADGELEAARQRYDERTAPLYGRLYDINRAIKNRAIKAGLEAERELFRSCTDPDLLAKWEQHGQQARVEHERQPALNAEIRDLQVRAESCRNEISLTNLRSRKEELLANAKSLDAARRKRERELAQVQKQIARLQQAEANLMEQMREV